MRLLGWDIGGSNTKVCRVEGGVVAAARSRSFEIKDAADELPRVLRELAAEAAGDASIDAHAVTMTAELSRNFLTKREGVRHVVDSVQAAFPPPVPIHVFTVSGGFVGPEAVPLQERWIASANWMATARLVAATVGDALLVDVGSTTTDLIPIVGGIVVNQGRTDPERLSTGELVYTGAVRTPVEGLAHEVSSAGLTYGVAAEGFATSGDVYVWLGELAPEACALPTADGRPASRLFAGERLRRAFCADGESMPAADVQALAGALADAQVARIASAIGRVCARHPSIAGAVVVGQGAFVGERAARAAGLAVASCADGRHLMESRCAPAAAVALLLDRALRAGDSFDTPRQVLSGAAPVVERVVKIGGGLLAYPDAFARVLSDVQNAAGVLVVPGGGPFADAVRALDGAVAPPEWAAHWMAVLAMDQYAQLLVSKLQNARRVETLEEARAALVLGSLPVLAPSRWLRQADPLPRSWDVTSDSIAAWVAAQARAPWLVLVKPPGATGSLVDAYFEEALPPTVTCEVVTADQTERLRAALGR